MADFECRELDQRGHSASAYVAAAAGAGEARLSLAEVMQRWQRDSEAASPEQVRKAEEWVTALTVRNDQRYAARESHEAGHAA
ncbi:MAG: hypothetical protein E6F99_25115 [Actinobacteria bacterium]|nr:MAG: hypothetical protein E6F99_25115 [Actinomycetota bacterium]HKN56617.1 hypothetical protein [Amycolatopsis sp.]